MKPYYEENGIAIYHADCRDVLPRLDMVTHIITDPPYSSTIHAKEWIGSALTRKGAPLCSTAFSGLGFEALDDELRGFVAREAARLAERWTLAFSDIESSHLWARDLNREGLEYIRTCVWDKVDGAPQFTGDRPANGAEAIICAHRPGRKRWNGGGGRNVFCFRANGEPGSKPHPSTKPLALMRHIVGLFADAGDLVLDPFMGSGTTLQAAKILKCRAIGVEIEERYCAIAAERLAQGVLDFEFAAMPRVEQLEFA